MLSPPKNVAALFVEADGIYAGMPGVDLWPIERDARKYAGPWPVVAHPPCERWGRFWHGSTRKPHQFALGDDGGCFASALASVRRYGGVRQIATLGAPLPLRRLGRPGDGASPIPLVV